MIGSLYIYFICHCHPTKQKPYFYGEWAKFYLELGYTYALLFTAINRVTIASPLSPPTSQHVVNIP